MRGAVRGRGNEVQGLTVGGWGVSRVGAEVTD